VTVHPGGNERQSLSESALCKSRLAQRRDRELVAIASARAGLPADVVVRTAPVAPPEQTHAMPSAVRGQTLAKHPFDVAVALLLIVTILPVLLLLALIVKLDSPGPILFRQRRMGMGMREFSMLKFRTMYPEAPSELHERFIAQLASPNHADRTLNKLTEDPRVTRAGRMLRRLSLDELPQLFNVLGRRMSLVGPRPAIPYELAHYRPADFERFSVRPGLTGLWQVSGRSKLGFREMLELDVEYARNATLAADARILARTPRAVIGRTA
jgi:lipopolysaccharide/colanic/teichoic acid biosynthesis glycosyltransferase